MKKTKELCDVSRIIRETINKPFGPAFYFDEVESVHRWGDLRSTPPRMNGNSERWVCGVWCSLCDDNIGVFVSEDHLYCYTEQTKDVIPLDSITSISGVNHCDYIACKCG